MCVMKCHLRLLPLVCHTWWTPQLHPMAAQGPAPGSLPVLDSLPYASGHLCAVRSCSVTSPQGTELYRFSITPRSPAAQNVWFCGFYWELEGRRSVLWRGSGPAAFSFSSALFLLLLPFLVQNNEQIKPAQAPWASSNCSDLVGYHLCPSLAAITKCHGLRVGGL